MSEACFHLKGSLLTLPVLELYHYSPRLFEEQLAEKVKEAPLFFQKTPVIISLEKLNAASVSGSIDFQGLNALCRDYGLRPIAVKGGTDSLAEAAEAAGFPCLPSSPKSMRDTSGVAFKKKNEGRVEPIAETVIEEKIVIEERVIIEEKIVQRPSMIVTNPVRSGQQLYAKGVDLIVLSQVGAGAEVISDGNIHVYGVLRGRALAGVSGDRNARIFCRSLEAELISVAGQYMLNEDLRSHHWEQPVQAYLKDEALRIDLLA